MQCAGFDADLWQPCKRDDAVNHRLPTRYADEKLNWRVLCPKCQKEQDEFWYEMLLTA